MDSTSTPNDSSRNDRKLSDGEASILERSEMVRTHSLPLLSGAI